MKGLCAVILVLAVSAFVACTDNTITNWQPDGTYRIEVQDVVADGETPAFTVNAAWSTGSTQGESVSGIAVLEVPGSVAVAYTVNSSTHQPTLNAVGGTEFTATGHGEIVLENWIHRDAVAFVRRNGHCRESGGRGIADARSFTQAEVDFINANFRIAEACIHADPINVELGDTLHPPLDTRLKIEYSIPVGFYHLNSAILYVNPNVEADIIEGRARCSLIHEDWGGITERMPCSFAESYGTLTILAMRTKGLL